MSLALDRVTIVEIAAALAAGELSSRALVTAHLARIEMMDPLFNSIRCVVPDALDQADRSDSIRRRGTTRSPLEGVPVLVKDNIDVAGLATTAGALALEHSVAGRDAHVVSRLREAGVIILGKTNLSELANFLTDKMPSGYSSLGGQVLNPYDTALTPSGSSSGSGAAVALGLAPLAVGTETDGSIISPAEHQSLVGCKPTLGLVSRTGILPIAQSQDTAGPMARTVADAAALLGVLAGPDPDDPITSGAEFGQVILDGAALVGARVGVVTSAADDPTTADLGRRASHDASVHALRRAGATLEDVEVPTSDRDDEMFVLRFEFAPGVDRYLAGIGPGASVRSLADLQAWNNHHAAVALKFGQTHVDLALAIDHDRERTAYLTAQSRNRAVAIEILEDGLGPDREALVFPGAQGCSLAARAGWPSVVVPAGYSLPGRRPFGVMLVSRPGTDGRLLSLAHALERALPARRPPSDVNPAVYRRFGRR
ncbi:MAG: amidase family protein [Acidimicrobiales bacterium]